MLHRVFRLLAFMSLVACTAPADLQSTGVDGAGDTQAPLDGSGNDNGVLPDVEPGDEASLDVYTRMRPTCVPCHGASSPRPMFSTFDAFMTLLVTATTPTGDFSYVEPGDPESSRLIALLDKSEGNYFMPVGEAFVDLEGKGQTDITLVEIEEWIRGLPVGAPPSIDDATPPTDGVLVRRLTVRQLVTAAHAVLGLEENDFWGYTTSYGTYVVVKNDQITKFPVRSPDATPDVQVNSHDFKPAAERRWASLGGADIGNGRAGNTEISPAFLQHWLQTSQAWCRMAVKKEGNDAILGPLSLADTTASNEAGIAAQIGALHLRILGEPATQAQTAVLLDEVFKVYEALSNTESAWTAVCSTLLRDVQFITF